MASHGSHGRMTSTAGRARGDAHSACRARCRWRPASRARASALPGSRRGGASQRRSSRSRPVSRRRARSVRSLAQPVSVNEGWASDSSRQQRSGRVRQEAGSAGHRRTISRNRIWGFLPAAGSSRVSVKPPLPPMPPGSAGSACRAARLASSSGASIMALIEPLIGTRQAAA